MKLFFIIIILIFSSTLFSNELKDYSFTFQDDDLIISLNLTEEADNEIFNLKNPFRLILTLKNTSLSQKIKKKNKINNEILKDIMAVQYSRNGIKNSKIIISLKKEVAYTIDKFGNRLLIILKNAKSNDQIASQIEKNEKISKKPITLKTKIKKSNSNMIQSFSYQYDNEDLLLSIKLDNEASFKSFELSEPFRLFLNIDNVELSPNIKNKNIYKDEYLKKVFIHKMTKNGKSKIRFSIFLKDKKAYSIEKINNNILIIIKGAKKIKKLASKTQVVKEKKVASVEAFSGNAVKSITYQYDNEDLLYSIKLNKEADFKSFELANPFRVFIDIKDVGLTSNIKKEIIYKDEYLKKAFITKMSRNGKMKVRISLSLKDKKAYSIEKINNNIILIIKGAKKIKTLVSKTPNKTKNISKEKKIVVKLKKPKGNFVKSLNYQYDNEDLIYSIKLNKDTSFKSFELAEPFRLFIDINNIELASSIKKQTKYNDEYLQKVFVSKMSRNGKTKIRISLFLKDKKQYSVEKINNNIIIIFKGAKKIKTVAVKKPNKVIIKKVEKVKKVKSTKKQDKKLDFKDIIDYSYNDNSLLIAMKLKKDTNIKHYHLLKPFRIILDLKNTKLSNNIKEEMDYTDKYIKNIKLIKYKRSGKTNTKVIMTFHEEKPFQVEKINKTILITLSNIVQEDENNFDIKEKEIDTENQPEEVISFKNDDETTFENNNIKEESFNKVEVKETRRERRVRKAKEAREARRFRKAEKARKAKLKKSNNISSKRRNTLNKVIFKRRLNGARITIKTKITASYETSLDDKSFSITLNNSSFGSRMASLSLNTEFFKTNVKKIIPRRKGKNIIIKFILVKSKTPIVRQANGIIELDF